MRPKYRRYPPTPVAAEASRFLLHLLEEAGLDLSVRSPDIQDLARSALDQARAPHRLHGKRTEEMFAYMVVALGAVRALKREETDGLIVGNEDDVAIPDFRLLIHNRPEILVEVKNFNEKLPSRHRTLKLKYLKRLAAYGRLFDRPVYLGVYWAPWRTWTLHPVDELCSSARRDSPTLVSQLLSTLPHVFARRCTYRHDVSARHADGSHVSSHKAACFNVTAANENRLS